MKLAYNKSTLLRIYFIITLIAHFLFYSLGEGTSYLIKIVYLVFSVNNIVFFYIFTKNNQKRFFLAYFILFLIILYGIIRNGLNLNAITDFVQILNILCSIVIIRQVSKKDILFIIYLFVLISFIASFISFIEYEFYRINYKSISYIAPVFIFYKFLTTKNKLFLIIFGLSFFILLVNGKRTNLILSIFGVIVLILKYKPILFSYAFITLFLTIIISNASCIKNIDFKTMTRIKEGIKDGDQSLMIRYAEIKSAFKETLKKPTINLLFGKGVGSFYKLESNFKITDKRILDKINKTRHIHVSPMNLFFKYGVVGVFFMSLFLIKLGKHLSAHSITSFIIALCIFLTFLDSLFRSVFVDILGVFFIALTFSNQQSSTQIIYDE